MTLDDLPQTVTPEYLAGYGFTPADVRRLCPLAPEYGPAHAPFWHRDDLGPLLEQMPRRDEP